MDQWLVRTADNWIAGPYPKEQVRQMILEGKLTLQDEVCCANGYWIYIHEREEVKNQLGIEVPFTNELERDEVTETQILDDDDDEITHSEIIMMVSPEAAHRATSQSDGEIVGKEKKRLGSHKRNQSSGPLSAKDESTIFWRGFAWLLVLLGCLVIVGISWFLNR